MTSFFLIAPTGDAYENLARDELILNELAPGSIVLYLYVNERAVIIGTNQNPFLECDMDAIASDGVQLVRRISGGGAVYHDAGNLNYSFIASNEIYDEARQTGVILKALKTLGIDAQADGRNDLTANGLKFSGNAFCRRSGASQHHGTLLIDAKLDVFGRYLTPSKLKLDAKGIKSVRARVGNLRDINPGIDVRSVSAALKCAFEAEYGASRPYAFSEEALLRLEELKQKRAARDWLIDRTPEFDAIYEGRLSVGNVRICLTVRGGKVSGCEVYTDSLDTQLPQKLKNVLIGLHYDSKVLSDALKAASDEIAGASDLFG